MARMRAFLAALGRDEMSGAARTALGAIVVFVPFGWIVLLTRWSPVRRVLSKLHREVPDAHEPPEGHEVPPLR